MPPLRPEVTYRGLRPRLSSPLMVSEDAPANVAAQDREGPRTRALGAEARTVLGTLGGWSPSPAHGFTVFKPQRKGKTQVGFRMPLSITAEPRLFSLRPSAGEGKPSSSNKLLVESAHPSIMARAVLHPAFLPQAARKPVVTIIPATSHPHFQRWNTPWLGTLHVVWILEELDSVFQLAPE